MSILNITPLDTESFDIYLTDKNITYVKNIIAETSDRFHEQVNEYAFYSEKQNKNLWAYELEFIELICESIVYARIITDKKWTTPFTIEYLKNIL